MILQNFSTTQAAKVCQVATRTIMKWCDQGFLPHFKEEGSKKRIIPRAHLLRFLNDNGFYTDRITQFDTEDANDPE